MPETVLPRPKQQNGEAQFLPLNLERRMLIRNLEVPNVEGPCPCREPLTVVREH